MDLLIDLRDFGTMDDIFDYLRRNLAFPKYFGENLDALYDVLSTYPDRLSVRILYHPENVLPFHKRCRKLIRVFEDAAECNPELTVTAERIGVY
ncbi:MAG: barstar family protein [Eubacteriales bacterium]|nr:barstar family protein [Eubacteriales bacterium]MDD3883127.1 barstar family protein [Eubacteriales bacterium]MDD4512703.1 barstar family protein [Eubacteriales bacterium]